jgi:sortase (surface protein transpeptidase)
VDHLLGPAPDDDFPTAEMPRLLFARPGTLTAPDRSPAAPEQPVSGQGVPSQGAPGLGAPGQGSPGQPVPDDTAPYRAVPGRVAPAGDADLPSQDAGRDDGLLDDALLDALADDAAADGDEPEDGGEPAGEDLPGATTAPRPEVWRTVVRTVGELMLTGGLVVLLFVIYELFITDLFTAQDQSRLDQQLHATWQSTPPAQLSAEPEPAVGRPVAIVHIPRLGSDYSRVIVEGTDQDQLAQGPGHYAGSAMPGQQGNFAIAGHRVGKGSPFLDLDTMRPGDPIVIETATQWLVYRVLGDAAMGSFTGDPSGIPGQQVVQPTGLDVISPTPDSPAGDPATGAYLTITTCNPKFSARTRLVVHARLDGGPISKASAPQGPAALHGH